MSSVPPPKDRRRIYAAVLVYLLGFGVLLVILLKLYLLPAMSAAKDAAPRERQVLAVNSRLMLAVVLFVLLALLLMTFRIGRFFMPRGARGASPPNTPMPGRNRQGACRCGLWMRIKCAIGKGNSNIEHSTSKNEARQKSKNTSASILHRRSMLTVGCSMFDVRCSMFAFYSTPSHRFWLIHFLAAFDSTPSHIDSGPGAPIIPRHSPRSINRNESSPPRHGRTTERDRIPPFQREGRASPQRHSQAQGTAKSFSPASSATATASSRRSSTAFSPSTTCCSWACAGRPRRASSACCRSCWTSGCPSWPASRSTTIRFAR